MAKILLIGQAPNRTGDPTQPLLGALGAKIARMSGLNEIEYLDAFDRINLVEHFPGQFGKNKGDAFPIDEARSRAAKLKPRLAGRVVIILGSNVAHAFGITSAPPMSWISFHGARVAVMPHPSGLNRWYNSKRNRRTAATFLKTVLAEV